MLGRAYIQSQSGQKPGMSGPSPAWSQEDVAPVLPLYCKTYPKLHSYPEKCGVATDPACTASIVIAFVVCLLLS